MLARRDWMRAGFVGAIAALQRGAAAQSFLTGASTGVQGEDGLRRVADELAGLGIHNVETSGSGTRLVDLYAGRAGELKDEFARRKLRLIGYAQYSMMGEAVRRKELVDLHLRIGRFIQPQGARYITHLWTLPPRTLTAQDYKDFAGNVNETGKRLLGETGLRIGYHAEREDVSAGLLDPVMESTDPRYFGLVADVGHLQAGGLDPLLVCKRYRSRIIAAHLRDFDPMAGASGGFVPLGKGVINLAGVIAFLRESGFTESVNAEGGGIAASRDHMVQRLGLEL